MARDVRPDAIETTFEYRRRHLDGTISVATTAGPVGVQRDATAFVGDYRWGGRAMTSLWRDGAGAAKLEPRPILGVRIWLIHDEPIRILQEFDEAGVCRTYRVDFATRSLRSGNVIYQTDLYLDLFITGDARDQIIEDEHELAIAVEQRLISSATADRLTERCEAYVQMLRTGRWQAWLASICDAPLVTGLTPHQTRMRASDAGWPAEAAGAG